MRKSIFFVAAAILLLGVVPVRVCAEPVPYEGGDEDGEYSIESFDQLESFAVMLQDYSFPDSTFTLIADIDCEGRALPTGEFAGTFDGQGNVISNLVVEAEGDEPAGLFGTISGTVQNLLLVNPIVSAGWIRVSGLDTADPVRFWRIAATIYELAEGNSVEFVGL